jgi:hypothetical protein
VAGHGGDTKDGIAPSVNSGDRSAQRGGDEEGDRVAG